MKELQQDRPDADVGVVVARFQTHELHDGHKDVIFTAMNNHAKVLVFLGVSQVRGSINNPLDFQARKQMILDEYPDVNVLYIKDLPCDRAWSKNLDSQIGDLIGPNSSAMLYGSRDSFIQHYFGKWPTTALKQDKYISGTEVRKQISRATMNSPEFRAGVIWAAYSRHRALIPTVHIAIWNEDRTEILVGKKANENRWRFIGGFAQPSMQVHDELVYESNAIREVAEETGVEVGDVTYLGSCLVDDWRYRGEHDKIATIFFETKYIMGCPRPGDDIDELTWLGVGMDTWKMLVEEHRPLFDILWRNYTNVS